MKTLIGFLTLTLAAPAFAENTLCKVLQDEATHPTKLYTVEKPSAKVLPELKGPEEFMVQLAVLFSHQEALTPKEAAEQFFDIKHNSDTGDIAYMSATLPNGKTQEIAYVVYYPGDNPYGLVFRVYRDGNGVIDRADPLASISDSDFNCLYDY